MNSNLDLTKNGLNIIAHGKVQGVFYRAFTTKNAKKYSVTGWARNLDNGTVEVMAFGLKQNLDLFVKQLSIGPPAAKVDDLEIKEIQSKIVYTDFTIHR